jgi:hypothetical protein
VHLLVCINLICGDADDTISVACRLRNSDPGSINTECRRSMLGIMLHKADFHFMQPILISPIRSKETSGYAVHGWQKSGR